MTRQKVLDDAAQDALANRLARLATVTQFDRRDEPQGWTLAWTFSELEGSSAAFLDDHIPRLVRNDLTDDEIIDVLHAIGEEFRHILYHLRDPAYYGYLHSPFDS